MQKPLAFLLRPTTIGEIIGQKHLINDQKGIISRMIKNNYASSLIFYGNAGIGKSSIALALANDLGIPFQIFNAEVDKKQNLDQIIENAKTQPRFIVIIEEIHRMNKDRQDILLQHLENGTIIMFACTTENPFFVINPAIRSRATILKLEPISKGEMNDGISKLLNDKKYHLDLKISPAVVQMICDLASGDLRMAINILELCLNLYRKEEITPEIIQSIVPTANLLNNSVGDEHHDLKSALQKSIRGSDVDGALYYFSRLLASGDFEALLRRMLIIAYEDIGMANPAIPIHVKTAIDSFRQIGLPEGRIPLGLAIIEMCLSEKSNSAYLATDQAYEDVLKGNIYSIPKHLRDTSYKLASKLGNGVGYKYPHDFPNAYVAQQYLPIEMKDVQYYSPKLYSVYEKRVNELFNNFKKKDK